MKICIIGNSHVGALKRAWDADPDPSLALEFFAARGARLRDLRVKRNRLAPKTWALKRAFKFTSAGQSRIEPDRYDCFLIYALQARPFLEKCENRYSRAVMQDALKDHVQNTISFDVLEKLRGVTDKKIYVGHNPLLAADGKVENRVSEEYTNGITELNRYVYNPANSEMIPQPYETIVNGHFTDQVYTKRSKRLSVGNRLDDRTHPEDDRTHMNEAFGRLWLNAFFERIKEFSKI